MHIWFAPILHLSFLIGVGTCARMHATCLAREKQRKNPYPGRQSGMLLLHRMSQD